MVAQTVAAVAIALLALTSAASAKELTGAFAAFKQCPRFITPADFCLYTKTAGGEVTIGNFRLPILNPSTVQGGYYRDSETGAETFYGALDGETMSRTPQPVPGGLLGVLSVQALPSSLRASLQALVAQGATAVNATTELAEPASSIGLSTDSLLNEEGIGLSLPVKIHLQNSFLGNECYIGSNRNPLILNLTDGTTNPPPPNKPIAGMLGNVKFEDELRASGEISFTQITHNIDLNNSFAVPAASGCGGSYSSLVDTVVDAKLGLPSPTGRNTIIENVSLRLATTTKVTASEE